MFSFLQRVIDSHRAEGIDAVNAAESWVRKLRFIRKLMQRQHYEGTLSTMVCQYAFTQTVIEDSPRKIADGYIFKSSSCARTGCILRTDTGRVVGRECPVNTGAWVFTTQDPSSGEIKGDERLISRTTLNEILLPSPTSLLPPFHAVLRSELARNKR